MSMLISEYQPCKNFGLHLLHQIAFTLPSSIDACEGNPPVTCGLSRQRSGDRFTKKASSL